MSASQTVCSLVVQENQMPPSASLGFIWINSQTRTRGALLSASQTVCSLVVQENQMPPSASLGFPLHNYMDGKGDGKFQSLKLISYLFPFENSTPSVSRMQSMQVFTSSKLL